MASNAEHPPEMVEAAWRAIMERGEYPMRRPWYRGKALSSLYHHLPHDPRCRICRFPFKGVGGIITREFFGVKPSRLTPQLCNECEQFAEAYTGGAEIEVSVLFADVRGSTRLAETMKPAEFSRLMSRFYSAATRVIFDHDGMMEKIVGDAVTGFFPPGLAGAEHAKAALAAAREILRVTGHDQPGGPWVPVGIGVHTGVAFIGSVHTESGGADIVLLGDTPNIGARLSSLATAGQVALSRETALAAGLHAEGLEIHQQALKGRNEPVEVWLMPG